MGIYTKQYRLAYMQRQGDFERVVPFGPLATMAQAEKAKELLESKGEAGLLIVNVNAI